MKTYIATEAVRIFSGLIALDDAQASARAYALEQTNEPGVYLIKQPIEFKIGERIGFDGDIPKGQATVLIPEEPEIVETNEPEIGETRVKRSRKK